MEVNKVIERAEKYRLLGRFDRNSAIAFLNDAIFEITKRQAIHKKYEYYDYEGGEIEVPAVLIKVSSIETVPEYNPHEDNLYVQMNEQSNIEFFRKTDQGRKLIELGTDIIKDLVIINYIGYKPVEKDDVEFDMLQEYETAIVYFLRSKMLEEYGEMEASQYFLQQYMREIISKAGPKQAVYAEPSPYSLM